VGLPAVSGVRVRFDRQKKGAEQLVSLTLSDGSPIETKALLRHDTRFSSRRRDGYAELATERMSGTRHPLARRLVEYIKTPRGDACH